MANQPYVAKLPDGRYFAVELPEGSTDTDAVTGEIILRPPAIHLLDQIRTLVSPMPAKITPNRLRILREGLGLSQVELAEKLHCPMEIVVAWEKGKGHPEADQVSLLDNLRKEAIQRGILLPKRNLAS